MQISSIIRQIQSTPIPRYEPAQLDIQLRNPEMDANWEAVWEELGLLPPSSFAKELKSEATQQAAENLVSRVQEGDRLGNIAKNKQLTFGDIAFERYMRRGVKDVQLFALPRLGVSIDVTIYPPEITIETKGVGNRVSRE